MGYNTKFTISRIEGTEEDYNALLEDLGQIGLSELAEFESETAHWYDYAVDMEQITKAHPDVAVLLCGNGEDTDDVWYEYWQNGKSYREVFKPKKFEDVKNLLT